MRLGYLRREQHGNSYAREYDNRGGLYHHGHDRRHRFVDDYGGLP